MSTSSVFNSVQDINFSLSGLRQMPHPNALLMCPPKSFDVIDVKNPYMEGQIGQVDTNQAMQQWQALKECFESIGMQTHIIDPLEGLEDMVFTANQTCPGLDAQGQRLCVLSHMKHPSRQKEVTAFAEWFGQHDYKVVDAEPGDALFEGCGDAIWHPGRALLWGGYGHRTDPKIYPFLAKQFGVPVISLELKSNRFYHLDTCFCAIDEETVLVYPASLTDTGMDTIRHMFERVIEVDEEEAMQNMACNATACLGKYVLIQQGSEQVNRRLRDLGYNVIEVDTGEFLKSGGSVFCMKMFVF